MNPKGVPMSPVFRLFNKDTQILMTFSESQVLVGCFYDGAAAAVATVTDRWPELSGLRDYFAHAGDTQCVVPPSRLDEARALFGRLRDTALRYRNLRVTVDEKAAALRVLRTPPEDFLVLYVRCGDGLERVLPGNVSETPAGWLLRGCELWHYPDLSGEHLRLFKQRRIPGEELPGFTRDVLPAFIRAGIRLKSGIVYDPEPDVSLTLHSVAFDRVGITPRWAVPPGAVDVSLAVPGHVLADGVLRPGIRPDELRSVLPDPEKDTVLEGEAVGRFLDRWYDPWKPWIRGEREVFEKTHGWIRPPYAWILAVRAREKRGVGKPYASPVACVGRERLTVQEVLEAREREYTRFKSGWVRRSDLETLGLDEAGAAIGRTDAKPFRLDTETFIHRGGRKLDGLWRGMTVEGAPWAEGGNKHACAAAHLRFLIHWGVNGGLIGGYDAFTAYGMAVLTAHAAAYPDCGILVMGREEDIGCLRQSYPGVEKIRFETYEKAAAMEGAPPVRWDITVMIEPEAAYDDLRERLSVERAAKIRSAVKLFFPFRSQPETGSWITSMMGLRRSSGLSRLLIRYCRETVKLPAPYVFTGQLPEAELRAEPARLHPAPGPVPVSAPVQGTAAAVSGKAPFAGGVIGQREADFFKEALNLADRPGDPAEHVPFAAFTPEYRQMDKAQRRWYFYLRDRIAHGEYPATDAAYLHVRIYEILALIGVRDASEGYGQLMGLWRHYRDRYPALDHELSVWTVDLIHVYPCGTDILEHTRGAPVLSGLAIDEALAKTAETGRFEIPCPILEDLTGYKFTRGRFFLQTDRERAERLITGALDSLDRYLRESEGTGILEKYASQGPRTQEVTAFNGARFAYPKKYTVRVIDHRGSRGLGEFLRNAVRYTENLLREREGYSSLLQGIDLKDPEKNALREAVDRAYGKQDPQPETGSALTRVVLDPERLVRLREETEAVRRALLGYGEGPEEGLPDHGTHAAGLPAEEKTEQDPGTAGPEETSADGWDRFFAAADREALAALLKGEKVFGDHARRRGIMPDVLRDEINALAQDTVGDLILGDDGFYEDYADIISNHLVKE